tara:strand:+ start:196 stop:660 length:465 start_codon:yes stop_codon:yes gene_type:complete
MNYWIRSVISLLFLYVIYKSFKVLQYQKSNEPFLNYSYALNNTLNNSKLKLDKQKREEAYKMLGTPEEWYNFKNEGYSYIDPKHWKIPQKYEPICYDNDDTFPSPIMSPGTDTSMFYNPKGEDKHVNEKMKFEKKPQVMYRTTIYTQFIPHSKV